MAKQFKKPESGRPAASGFLHPNIPVNLFPGQIRRGDYCHRFQSCSQKNKIDPKQIVCLICERFIPLFPGVDPLGQARVMGYKVGYKTIKQALEFEAKAMSQDHIVDNNEMVQIPSEKEPPTPHLTTKPPRKKLNGRKPRAVKPGPGPGLKRCSNTDCKNPVLPATPEYFPRNRCTRDGLGYYCKSCQKEKQSRSCAKNKLKNTGWVKAGPPIGKEVTA